MRLETCLARELPGLWRDMRGLAQRHGDADLPPGWQAFVQALFEARRSGIHPFCITIDREGKEYLPHMYGHANWAEIDEVRKLPLKVADIYRRLPT